MSTRHVAENIALLGSILGRDDYSSTLGDATHRFGSLFFAGATTIDYLTSLQFKKNDVNSIKIESTGRISGLVDPLYDQDAATKIYVDTHGGGGSGHTIQWEGTSFTQRTNLNFTGTGFSIVDDLANNATVLEFTGGGGGGGYVDLSNFVFANDEWVISDDEPVTVEYQTVPVTDFDSILVNAAGYVLTSDDGTILVTG